MDWPASFEELVDEQERLALAEPPPWGPPDGAYSVGGCFVCFPHHHSGPGGIPSASVA